MHIYLAMKVLYIAKRWANDAQNLLTISSNQNCHHMVTICSPFSLDKMVSTKTQHMMTIWWPYGDQFSCEMAWAGSNRNLISRIGVEELYQDLGCYSKYLESRSDMGNTSQYYCDLQYILYPIFSKYCIVLYWRFKKHKSIKFDIDCEK